MDEPTSAGSRTRLKKRFKYVEGGLTQFRILGPLEAIGDGQTLPLGGPKPRTLLAVLLVADSHPVSADQLIEELWGDSPPLSAATVLQVYVSGLRKLFGTRLRRTAGGYALEVAAGELDVDEFTRLIGEAREHLDEQPATAVAERWRCGGANRWPVPVRLPPSSPPGSGSPSSGSPLPRT